MSGKPADTGVSVSLSGVVLDAPDPRALASFYRRLLGWSVEVDGPEWVSLRAPDGGTKLSFQREPEYRTPAWPSRAAEQQMQLHLDLAVDDITAAYERAVSLGAQPAQWQPQDDVRVMVDPVGHVFCLFRERRPPPS